MTGRRAWRITFTVTAAAFIGASTLWWITEDPGPPTNRPRSTIADLILYP